MNSDRGDELVRSLKYGCYLAVLGRQPELSLAELDALHFHAHKVIKGSENAVALIDTDPQKYPKISRLGGTQKIAVQLKVPPLDYLANLPKGKIVFGISDYSPKASQKKVAATALKFKRSLKEKGRSVRIVESKTPVMSNATSLHNGLASPNPRKVELIRLENDWYLVEGVQDIDAYASRDQARPSRDAKVGMLPPKLAQILINLCGPLYPKDTLLDPFCGTGVVLQEAMLMGLDIYGTDINPRMIEYTESNLSWAAINFMPALTNPEATLDVGNAMDYIWTPIIDAVACECYLGAPMSKPPTEVRLKAQMLECRTIILGFLKNLSRQIMSDTPVVIATPAWLRNEPVRTIGSIWPNFNLRADPSSAYYQRLEILDEIEKLRYNVDNKSRHGLLYYRKGQIVARDIIILRKT